MRPEDLPKQTARLAAMIGALEVLQQTRMSPAVCAKEISTTAELMALVSHALMEQIVPARMDLHSLSSQHYQDSGGPEQRSKYLHLVQKDTAR